MSDVYRRSPHLVCYWLGRQLVVENYARRRRVAATPRTCEILDLFDRWRPVDALVRRFPDHHTDVLARALTNLIRVGLIERSHAPQDRQVDALAAWKTWSPAASFFHFTTKDQHAPVDDDRARRKLRRRALTRPMPPPVKRYPGTPQIELPPPDTRGEFPRVLLERRTWRQFARQPLELEKLATLLGLSFGVQWWVDLRGIGRVGMKTSPSGGCRHPIEAYVVALRVNGLQRGFYHYDAGAHRLELLRRGATAPQVVRYLNGQSWFGGAAVVVLMTAVFARSQWKYRASRAYRVVLIDAGHVCQTFCLVATWLGLAPFCTMALADSKIEGDLAIDGVGESILYTAGVGCRPHGTEWAPWHSKPRGSRSVNTRLKRGR